MTIEFPLRVVLYPAPDVEGQWMAHGLETDGVTQGNSPQHALAMMADALQTLTAYNASNGPSAVGIVHQPYIICLIGT
jgi:predicted RNase H-like HicB family nuclease